MNFHYIGEGNELNCPKVKLFERALWCEYLDAVTCKLCKEVETKRRKEVAEWAKKRFDEWNDK